MKIHCDEFFALFNYQINSESIISDQTFLFFKSIAKELYLFMEEIFSLYSEINGILEVL
jgi:hypothetical protein